MTIPLESAFDSAAQSYDTDFTKTETGRLQRKMVHEYLDKTILQNRKLKVLELNCGTGADAIWLAQNGNCVLATDLSKEMIVQGKNKWKRVYEASELYPDTSEILNQGSVEFRQMDLRSAVYLQDQFDLVFSNFGGINCISPQDLASFMEGLPNLIKPNGHFVAVIMAKFCVWETLYFLLKFRFRAAFRRFGNGPLPSPLKGGAFQDTWYYSPKMIRDLIYFQNTRINVCPVGFFLPPSYLEPFFRKHPYWLNHLAKWEHSISQSPSFGSISDHFLISVQFLSTFPL